MNNINLANEILMKIPDGLTQLEEAYYVYIRTCQIFSYDTRYNDSPYILAEAIKYNYQRIGNIKNINIVCSVWAKIYMDLLSGIGIKASLINRNGHSWVESYVDDMIIYSDPTYGVYTDFSRAKHNDSIHHFYPVTAEKTDKLPLFDSNAKFDIEELNRRIGYQVKEEEFFSSMEEKISEISGLKAKVDYILENANLIGTDNFADWEYLRNILRVLLPTNYQQIIYAYLTKVNDDYTFDNKFLMTVIEDDNYYYYLFDKDIDLLSKEEVLENANLGYGIKTLYKPIGLDYPLKFETPKASLHYFLNIKGFKNKNKEKCYNKIR